LYPITSTAIANLLLGETAIAAKCLGFGRLSG